MKYILVQFQNGKDKPFSGKHYIYKYNKNKITCDLAIGDIIDGLINSSGYHYRNKAIIIKIFNTYKEYQEAQDFNDEIVFDEVEIKELVNISIYKKMLQVGDKVKIHKPKDTEELPRWIPAMNMFDGQIGEITGVNFQDPNHPCFFVDYETCAFGSNWLEKIPDENDIKSNELLSNIVPSQEFLSSEFYSPITCQLIGQDINNSYYFGNNISQTDVIKESEGNKMDFSNILNVEFGKINDSHDVAASMYGIAIRGNDNRYRAYDKANGKIIDVTGMTFNTDMLFKIPCAISQISVGDVIINAGNYVTVTNVHKDGTFTVVDPRASEQKIAIPAKNMFGFDFMTKVFYPLDSFIKPTDDNPFGLNPMAMMLLASDEDMDMSTLVLMTMMGNGATNQNMMLPMILMMNKNGRSSDMGTLALTMMMGQTNTLDMSNRRKYTYKHHDASKEVESYRRALETSPVPEPIYDDVSDVPDAINPCAD